MGEKHLSLRLPEEMLYKLHDIAAYDGRSVSAQVRHWLGLCIARHEQKHGYIGSDGYENSAQAGKAHYARGVKR
nr:hypothetical protein [Maliibacterium massiliense]